MLNKICTMTAKSAPSRFFGKKAGTQPPHIAGSLAVTRRTQYPDFQRTSKPFAALPCNCPGCKTHAFYWFKILLVAPVITCNPYNKQVLVHRDSLTSFPILDFFRCIMNPFSMLSFFTLNLLSLISL
jgi:hypothetical protein